MAAAVSLSRLFQDIKKNEKGPRNASFKAEQFNQPNATPESAKAQGVTNGKCGRDNPRSL